MRGPELYWIAGPWKGRLAISTRPRGGDWLEGEIASWRGEGVNVVLSLLTADEQQELDLDKERVAAESAGIAFRSLPIPDLGIPGDVLLPLRKIEGHLASGESVAVHCRQGVGRSGMIAAALLILSGVDVREAIASVSSSRGIPVPETPVQRDWLFGLARTDHSTCPRDAMVPYN